MRVLRILQIIFGLTVGLPLGCMVLYTTIQLNQVTQKTKPTPQVLSAAQLVAKGALDNLHVELTGFIFGKPVIETDKEGWVCVWLPVEPDPKAPDAKPQEAPKAADAAQEETAKRALFFRAEVRDQAALDELLKQPRLKALATTPLPKGNRWRVKCSATLRKAYPDLDLSHVLFLAEPRLSLLDQSVELSDPQLYDASYEAIGAWGGMVLLLFAFLSFYLIVYRRRAVAVGAATPDTESHRAQLEMERPESVHQAQTSGIIRGVLWYGFLAVIMIPAVVFLAVAAVRAQTQGKPLIAVNLTFLALPLFFGVRASLRTCVRRLRWPTDIAVCPSGLRWRQGGKHRTILWTEVTEVLRVIKEVPRMHQTGLVGALQQLNNPLPPIIVDTVRLTLDSGESFLMSPTVITNYPRFAETTSTLWKEDGLRSESAGITDAWLKSLRKQARNPEKKGI
jgi:hypothetical protein